MLRIALRFTSCARAELHSVQAALGLTQKQNAEIIIRGGSYLREVASVSPKPASPLFRLSREHTSGLFPRSPVCRHDFTRLGDLVLGNRVAEGRPGSLQTKPSVFWILASAHRRGTVSCAACAACVPYRRLRKEEETSCVIVR